MEKSEGSLAYRKNFDDIWRGKVPDKYTRLLPYIRGKNVIELGAAEGVLSLLLAQRDADVLAVELRRERHHAAVELQQHWLEMGKDVSTCTMLCADILNNPHLLDGKDSLVAVRSIYYLRDDAVKFMEILPESIDFIMLCGNGNRAKMYKFDQIPDNDGLGMWNRWATVEGMMHLLECGGFEITNMVNEGDPIVTGKRNHSST